MSEIVNPYIAGAPVVEARMFFGREDVFEWIENSLAGRYADHILVVHGQRRVGKTSVLKQLDNRLPDRYVPVFFDLQGRTHTTLDRFLWWLAREIVRVLKQDHGIEVPTPDKEAFIADPEFFETQFLNGLQPRLGEKTLLLTFDEFDNLEESEVKETFSRPLIDYLRRLMGTQGLNFIFSIGSSGRKLENMQAAYTDFFKTALYKKISFLNEEQTRNLVTRPVEGILEYERGAIDRIYSITSGHPYFTQLTCHELFARCQRTEQRRVDKQDVEAILEDVVERGTVNLKFVWDEASDIEKWGLAALAQLEKPDPRAVADYLRKQRVRFSDSDLTSGLLRLRDKDVLTPDNRFVIHLLKLWLQKNRPIEQVREELTEVNPIANRYIEIGLEFKEARLYDKAIESFREALLIAKDNIQAQVSLALVYMEQKAYDKAIIEFEKALVMDDEDVSARSGLCEAHLALGDAAMTKGRLREAVLSYQRVLEINGEHTEARGRMAELSRLRAEKALLDGRDEEALSAFAEALTFTPEDQVLIKRLQTVREEKKAKILASLLTRAGKEASAKNWDGALKSLQEALSLAPGDASIQKKIGEVKTAQEKAHRSTQLNKADMAVKAGRWDEAIETLGALLTAKPDAEIEAKLARIRSQQHNARLAELKTQAQGLTRLERFDDAIAAWNDYLAFQPDDQAEVEVMLQQTRKVAKLAGDYTEAQEAIRKKHYGRAIELLQGIIAQDPAYKATTRLLVEAVQANKAIPIWRRPWLRVVMGILGAAVVIVLGIFYGPKAWGMLSAALQRTPVTGAPQSQTPTEPSELISLEPILTYISVTAPDFTDDFSSPTDPWGQIAEGILANDLIADGALKVVLEAGNPTEKFNLSSPLMDASNFVLAFDFYFESSSGGTSSVNVGFPSTGDGSETNFNAQLGRNDQNLYDFYWSIGLTGQTIDESGILENVIKGEWNTMRVVYSDSQAAVFLNGELLDHVVGIPRSGAAIWIVAATGGQAEIWLDNVKYWDLDSFDGSSLPADLVALEPVLRTYLETKIPDLDEDFSTTNNPWNLSPEGITIGDLIVDNTLKMVLVDGTTTGKITLSSPNMRGKNFWLEYDFYFEGSTGSDSFITTGFPSTGDGDGMNLDATINLDSQTWSIGLSDGTIAIQGSTSELLQGHWNHMQMVYYDSQVAVYLNGVLLDHAESIARFGDGLWIVAATTGQAEIWLDNVKYWDLDSFGPFNLLEATATSAANLDQLQAVATALLQSYLLENGATFKDDFSAPSMVWGGTNEGHAIYALVADGVLTITDHAAGVGTDEGAIPGVTFPTNGLLDANNFGLQFSFGCHGGIDSLELQFRSYGILVDPCGGTWSLYEIGSLQSPIQNGTFTSQASVGNNLFIIVYEENLAVYLDDTLVHVANDMALSGSKNTITVTGQHGSSMDFDNLTFWNLDGVEIGMPGETPGAQPSILTGFESYSNAHTPTIEDDFSTPNADWGITNESDAFAYIVYDGKLNIMDRVLPNAAMASQRDPGISFPVNGLLDATNFGLQFDYACQDQLVDYVGVEFRSYELRIYPCSQRWLLYEDGKQRPIVSDEYFSLVSPEYTLFVLVYHGYLVITIDERVVYSVNALALSGSTNTISVNGQNGAKMAFDNFKFWNLDGVTLNP